MKNKILLAVLLSLFILLCCFGSDYVLLGMNYIFNLASHSIYLIFKSGYYWVFMIFILAVFVFLNFLLTPEIKSEADEKKEAHNP